MQVYYSKSQRQVVPGFLFKSVSLSGRKKKNVEITLEDENEGEQEQPQPAPIQSVPEVEISKVEAPEVKDSEVKISEIETPNIEVPEVEASKVEVPKINIQETKTTKVEIQEEKVSEVKKVAGQAKLITKTVFIEEESEKPEESLDPVEQVNPEAEEKLRIQEEKVSEVKKVAGQTKVITKTVVIEEESEKPEQSIDQIEQVNPEAEEKLRIQEEKVSEVKKDAGQTKLVTTTVVIEEESEKPEKSIDPVVQVDPEAQEKLRIQEEKAERQRKKEKAEAERKQKEAEEKEKLLERKRKEDLEKKEKQAALLKARQLRAAKEISDRLEQERGSVEKKLDSSNEGSKTEIQTSQASVAKPRRRSISYEEEEEEEREDSDKEEELEVDGSLHVLNPLESPLNPIRSRQEISEWADKRRARWAGGLFGVVFLGSIALWTILFRSLSLQNSGLSQAVLGVPTLGEFHGKYTDFYTAYNANVDEMIRARQLVSGVQAPARASLFELFAQREAVTRSVAKLRDALASPPQGRLLASEYGKKPLLEVAKTLQKQLTDFKASLAKLPEAQRTYVSHFDGVVDTLRKMYSDSLVMIDLYGEFFYMTHRIWVATENIFRLFERRAVEVNSEMALDHYESHSTSANKVFLGRTAFATLTQVSEVPFIKVEADRPATLVCSASAEIDNEDFISLQRSFELKLLAEGHKPDQQSPFKYQVAAKRDRLSFVQVLDIPHGSTNIQLFAKVEKTEVKLENFSCTCVKLTDYAKWPETLDYRLT